MSLPAVARPSFSALVPAWLRGGVFNVGGDQARDPHAGLLKDNRGVIMVVGVAFTFLWIGMAWSIFGIGNAIAYRENLQNATDASAFAGAVYDARGMNMLASINIVMSVVLCVLLVCHILQIIVMIGLGIDCWICIPDMFCGYGWLECPEDCEIMGDANEAVEGVDDVIHVVLEVLHPLEVGVAVAWPWVAAGKSTTLSWGYYQNGVSMTSTFSVSQLAFNTSEANAGAILQFIESFTGDGMSIRYGLPVSAEKYSELCTVSILTLTNLDGLISMPSFISGLVNDAGEWFCDAGGDSTTPTAIIQGLSDLALPCILYGTGDGPNPTLPASDNSQGYPWDLPVCNGDQCGSGGKDVQDDSPSQSPMRLFDGNGKAGSGAGPANMGTDYFGVWATGVGNYADVVTRKVQVAGIQSKATLAEHLVNDPRCISNPAACFSNDNPIPSDTGLAVSKAEFYYEPYPSEGKNSYENEIKVQSLNWPIDMVMYNLRWRARLRRYHNFPGLLGDTSLQTANWGQAGASALGAGLGTLVEKGGSPTDAIEAAETAFGDSLGLTQVDTYKNPIPASIFH